MKLVYSTIAQHFRNQHYWPTMNKPIIGQVIVGMAIKKMPFLNILIIISGLAILRLESNGPAIMEFDIFVWNLI